MSNSNWLQTHYYIFIIIGLAVIFMILLIVGLRKRRKRHRAAEPPAEPQVPERPPEIIPEINYDRTEFEIKEGVLTKYLGNALEIRIPEGVKSIGKAFYSLQRIRKVVIPKSVTEIGCYAFANCKMLSDVTFTEGLTLIATGAFQSCESLQKLDLPKSVSVVEPKAFERCRLKEIRFRCNNLSKISYRAFDNAFEDEQRTTVRIFVPTLSAWLNQSLAQCFGPQYVSFDLYVNNALLESATISANVPHSCFLNCASLKKVKFESAVEEIGQHAFVGCHMSELYIPETIVEIGDNAFQNCEELKKVTIPSAYRARVRSVFTNLSRYPRTDIDFEFYD